MKPAISGGIVALKRHYLMTHSTDWLNRRGNEECRARQDHPLERVMSMEDVVGD